MQVREFNMVCPTCGSEPKAEVVTENCNLLKGSVDVLTVCVNKDAVINFTQAEENTDVEDPCIMCQHNAVFCDQGTAIGIEPNGFIDGRPQFNEIHQCACGSVYKICI